MFFGFLVSSFVFWPSPINVNLYSIILYYIVWENILLYYLLLLLFILKVKDSYNISDKAYRTISKELKLKRELPPLYWIIQLRNNFNKDLSLNSSYYGWWNNLNFKYSKILQPIAQRLNYFDENNIITLHGNRDSKYPFII